MPASRQRPQIRLSNLCDIRRGHQFSWVRLNGPLKINILEYEAHRSGAGAQVTDNLVGFFRTLLSLLQSRHRERPDEAFWRRTGNQLLKATFQVFLLAKAPLKLDNIVDFILSAPGVEPKDDEAWRDTPVFGEFLTLAEQGSTTAPAHREFHNLKSYWLKEYPGLAPNTRSCIAFGLLAMLDVLRSPGIYEMLCTDTFVLTPELAFNGQVIILDLPVKEFGKL